MKVFKKLVEFIAKDTHMPVWLIIVLATVFALRIPTFFEPYWYGDETLYLTLGEGIRNGLLLYRDIYDNKPPLLYIVATIAGNIFWFRVILAFWVLTTLYFLWRLGGMLFDKNERLVKYACVTFAILTTIPLLEGTIANAEIFMIGPVIVAFTLLLRPRLKKKTIFLAGILIGVAGLFKVPAIFDSAAIALVWMAGVLLSEKKDWKEFASKTGILIGGILIPISATIIFFGVKGVVGEYLTAAFLQNIGYLSSWRGREGDLLTRNGPLLTRALIILIVATSLFLLHKKRRISRQFLFIGGWFAVSLFAATLSERPYPHYLIQVIPSFSLLVGMLITLKTREQFFTYPLLGLLGAALLTYKFYYFQVFPYYQNFLLWVSGQQSKQEYFNHFDARMNRNYAISQFLATSAKPKDKVFVWGNDPEIYVLSNLLPATRYVVAYHVTDFDVQGNTITKLNTNPPRFIITIPSAPPFPELNTLLNTSYLPVQQIENATIWLRMNNKLKETKLLPNRAY